VFRGRPAARAPWPAGAARTVSTGRGEWRTTFSATLPIRKWASPVRPCVAMTTQVARRAASTMRPAGSPTTTRDSTPRRAECAPDERLELLLRLGGEIRGWDVRQLGGWQAGHRVGG